MNSTATSTIDTAALPIGEHQSTELSSTAKFLVWSSVISVLFLSQIAYKKVPREKVKLPKRAMKHAYDDETTLKGRRFIPERY